MHLKEDAANKSGPLTTAARERVEDHTGLRADHQACRETGRTVLLRHAERLRRKADQLEALARAIPENFPLDADEALWEMALQASRW